MHARKPKKTVKKSLQFRYEDLIEKIQISAPEFYRSNASPTGKAIAYISVAAILGFAAMASFKADPATFIIVASCEIILCLILALADANHKNRKDPP